MKHITEATETEIADLIEVATTEWWVDHAAFEPQADYLVSALRAAFDFSPSQPTEGAAELIVALDKFATVLDYEHNIARDYGPIDRAIAALSGSQPVVHFAPWQAETTACGLPILAPRDAALAAPSDKWNATTCPKCLTSRPTLSDEELIERVQTELDKHEFEGDNTCSCGQLWDVNGNTDGVVWTIAENRHLAEVAVTALTTPEGQSK